MTAETALRRSGGLKRALLFSASGTAGARLTGALGGLLAARLLGPSGRGQLAILVFLATAASMAAAAGVQFWVAREVARHDGVQSVLGVVRMHAFVLTGVVLVVGGLTAGLIGSLAEVGSTVAWLTIGVAITNALQLLGLALPNGLRAMGTVAAALVIAGLLYVATMVGLLAADYASLSLVLVGMAVGNVVSIGLVLLWASRAPRGAPSSDHGASAYLHALRFGGPAGAGELVLLAMLRVDVLIVAAFLPLRAVGLYAVATAIAEVLWIIPDGVAQVVLPTTANNPAESHTPRLIRLSLVITGVLGCVLVVVARPLVEFAFGTAFGEASVALPLLVVASLAGGMWKIVGSEIVALGLTTPRLWSALAGLVVMVLVDLVAVHSMGIAGAALGSACGYAVAAVVVFKAWSTRANRSTKSLLGLTACSEGVR